MASNRIGNLNFGRNHGPGITRGAGVNHPSNHRSGMGTGSRYTQLEIANDTNKLFEALAVLQRIKIEEITTLLVESDIATETNWLFGNDSDVKWAEQIDGQMEYRDLEIRYHELQQKLEHNMVTITTAVTNENEKQRSMLMKTEQELLQQKNEISRLKRHVELVEKESKFLKAQLQDKEMQLLKQKQGRNLNMEYEQLQMKLKDLQRKLDKTEYGYQAMVIDKMKVENENEKLRVMLRKTEHDFSEQKSEISKLKKRIESMNKESKSLKDQLEEKEMQLLKQKQGRNLNVENKHLEMRHKDLQRKFDKIKDDYQSMALDKTKLENEIEKLRSMLRKTEQEVSEKTSEISRLKTRVELVDEETESLKAQLQEKGIQLLKQKQGRNLYVENEQIELRHQDLQHKFDKMKDEYQSMLMDRTKLENEVKKLRGDLGKTEHEFSEQKSEISELKKRVESVDEESKALKAQLQEKEIELLKQNQVRNLDVENEQLEPRHKDLQRKFDKTKDEYQLMVMDKTKLENDNKNLMSMLSETKHEIAEKTNEISRLNKLVESVDEERKSLKAELQEKQMQLLQLNQRRTWDKESKFLKAQLQENEMQLIKQTQGRNVNVEYEQLELRHKELQEKFDTIKDEYQSMMVDKTKIVKENEKLSTMLRKTEQESLEQNSQISRLKTRLEFVDEETKSLKEQLQEKEMQLLKQKQERNLNVKNEQLELRHKDLQRTFDKIKEDYQSMAMDKTKLEHEIKNLMSILRKTENEFSEQKSETSRLKKRVESVDKESKSLKEQLQEKEMQLLKQKQERNLNVEYEQLELRHKDLQRKFDNIKDDYQSMMMDKTKLVKENEKLSTMLRKTEQESLEQKSEISRLKKHVEKMDQESESFKAHLQEKERQLQEQRLATKKAYAEKDDALTRLSRHMGQQMSEGNPSITDLSDQNRPSKLGERYSELYDNEWTDAFEVLMDKFGKDIDDKSAIEILRKILLEFYKSAFDFSLSQMKEAEYKLSGSSKEVSPECKRLLKEARKHIDIKRADCLQQHVLEGSLRKVIDRRYLNETKVQVFATECVQLCWFMSIQDPPLVLAEDPIQGNRFDTNMYKHYTNSGDTVDYVVWPALLLHKGGPLLTKGVAQPFPRPSLTAASDLLENQMTDNGVFDKKSRLMFGNKLKAVTSAKGDPLSWRNLEYNQTPNGAFSSQRNSTSNQRLTGNATHLHLN